MGSRTNKPSVKTLGKERRWICLSPLRDAVPNGAGYGCNKDYMDCTAKLALNAISHTSTESKHKGWTDERRFSSFHPRASAVL